MTSALTTEQVNQVIHNTMLVLLVRPDLSGEWQENLLNLLDQARESALEDEAIFVASVLTLLYSPDDELPTGTKYDHAWQSILTGLRTGVAEPVSEDRETITLDRLLRSVTEAVLTVIQRAPDQADTIRTELAEMRRAAIESNVIDLVNWLDDVTSVIDGTPPHAIERIHEGIYGAYWKAIQEQLEE